MNLFQPDNFSQSEIQYAEIAPPLFVADVLRSYFIGYQIKNIFRLERSEINSENFKIILEIDGEDRIVLLRRYKNLSNLTQIFYYLNLLEGLAEQGVLVSSALVSLDGKKAVSLGEDVFSLFDFIGGDYFAPTPAAFVAVARAVAKMHLGFNKLSKDCVSKIEIFSQHTLAYYNKIKNYTADDFLEIGRIIKSQTEQSPEDVLVLNFLPSFIATVDEIKSYQDSIQKIEKKIIHSDLHPHNILIDRDEVRAILDFDAVRISEQARDVAFALYRFGRQFFVFNLLEQTPAQAQKLAEQFLEVYCGVNPLTDLEKTLMPIILKDEFMRKILFVLNGVYREKNFKWAQDLHKFLPAIAEINYFWSTK